MSFENSLDLLKIDICKLNGQFVSTSGRNRFGSGRVRVSVSNFRSGYCIGHAFLAIISEFAFVLTDQILA